MTGLPATNTARMAGWLTAVGSAGGLRADGGEGGDGGGVGWQLAQQIPWQVWLVAVGVLFVVGLIVVLWARHVWRRLTSDVNSTRMAVAAAAAAAPVGGQLAALAYESDPGRRVAGLAAARPAAEQILGAAARIRTALVSTRVALDEPALAAMSRDVDEELTGLAAYTQAYRELGRGQA